MRIVVGIDEAGRGCLVGPLVVGMVAVNETQAEALKSWGVQDSKKFGSGEKAHIKRKALAEKILGDGAIEAWHVAAIAANGIDRFLRGEEGYKINLNEIEQCLASSCLSKLPVHYYWDKKWCERPDSWPEAPEWEVICDGAQVFGDLQHGCAKITAVNDGESFHVAVAAASILAKVSRDEHFLGIRKKYSEFEPITGNGYGNPGTYSFIRKYQDKYGHMPEEVRRTFIKI